ncbi:DUF4339 domain-containing protein [Mesoterricola silvestris]|uniref:GYF domain-containing protein n=1 Tax=Mesoterricola silvestris TaxID=2927979 RepID=A0AA48GQM6_9BACT|nr:DUF4339 domain-containing protein [Mesoterricola silvestris]BDU74324.1 hypothetical protein METEAL_34980 [Mesoterricola silvestris]
MSEAWSYIQNGATQGPVPQEVLQELLATGQVRPGDLVWRQGLPDWTPAGTLPELRAVPPPPQVFPGALPPPAAEAVPAAVVEALRATRPWVRFMGVLGILGTVFLAVIALVFLGMTQGPLRGMPQGLRMVLPGFYLVMAAFQVPPVIFLNRYASRITDLLADGGPEALAEALRAQKSFWRYVGIMTLVVLCLYILGALVGIGAAVLLGGLRHF